MTSYVQVLGNHEYKVPSQLLVVHNQHRFLVNAGENTQRFGMEHGVRFSRVSDIFLTEISPSTFSGLPGLLLTLETGRIGVTETEAIENPLLCDEGSAASYRTVSYQTHWESFDGIFGKAQCRCFRRPCASNGANCSSASSSLTTVRIWGPPPLYETFTWVSRHFAALKFLNIELYELVPSVSESQPTVNSVQLPLEERCEVNAVRFSLTCVEMQSDKSGSFFSEQSSKRRCLECHVYATGNRNGQAVPEGSEDMTALAGFKRYSMQVHIQFPTVSGRMDMQKVASLKIPRGPLLGKLKNGEGIVLEDGTKISPEMVCGPPLVGGKCIVSQRSLACRWGESLHSLDSKKEECVTFILTPRDSTCWPPDSTSSVKDTVLGEPFVAANALKAFLRTILPAFCPGGFCCRSSTTDTMMDNKQQTVWVPSLPPLSRWIFAPHGKKGFDVSNALTSHTPTYQDGRLERLKAIENAIEICRKHFAAATPCADSGTSEPSAVITAETGGIPKGKLLEERITIDVLGTGAAMPSKYRNVSGTLLRLQVAGGEANVLLDCGEGTLSQMLQMAETEESFCRHVQGTVVVFISHRHADHHLGLPAFLAARDQMAKRRGQKNIPLVVYGPQSIGDWLAYYHKTVAPVLHTFVSCDTNSSMCMRLEDVEVGLKVTEVEHIRATSNWNHEGPGVRNAPQNRNACYAVETTFQKSSVTATTEAPVRIVYSGDTRPCDSVVTLSMGCDVLIHEATFEDSYAEEAVKKRHSTIGEAVSVARRAKVRFLLLTHFSQRYPSIPILSSSDDTEVLYAPMIDGLSIPLRTLLQKQTAEMFFKGFQALRPILECLRDGS